MIDSLSALYCFGAPMLAVEKLESKARLSRNFVQEYGASFCGRITALRGADIDAKPETVGRPLTYVEVQVVDDGELNMSLLIHKGSSAYARREWRGKPTATMRAPTAIG